MKVSSSRPGCAQAGARLRLRALVHPPGAGSTALLDLKRGAARDTGLARSERDIGLTDNASYRNAGAAAQTDCVRVLCYSGSSNAFYTLGLSC